MSTFTKKISIKIIFDIIKEIIPWTILKYSNDFFGSINNHYTFSKSKKWTTKDKNSIYCWACDQALTSGEGRLLYKFVSENLYDYSQVIIKNANNKIIFNKSFNLNEIKNNKKTLKMSFYESYIMPFLGIFYLWYKYILGNKVCYVNYLPLWNIALFLFLPPGTRLGPITGSLYKGKVNNLESFVRKYIIPILYTISGKIILSWRKRNLIFSTNMLLSYISPEIRKKSKFNFIFNNIKVNLYNKVRDIDLLVYNRNYFNKSNFFFSQVVTKLQEANFKVYYFGEKFNFEAKNYKGIIEIKKVREYLNRSKFTLVSSENFYSFYFLDAITNNVNLFYDKNTKLNLELLDINNKKIISIDYSNPLGEIDKIKEEIINFDNRYNYPY